MRFGANEQPDYLAAQSAATRDRSMANRLEHQRRQMEAARERQAQKAEAEAARELERLRRLELAQQRFGRTIDAPDPEVWALLLTDGASPATVADLLEVTEATLAAWMQAPERAADYQDFLRRRGLLSALAALPVSQDQSRDPKCRAVEHRARTWEAEAMGRQEFGSKTQVDHHVTIDIAAILDAAAGRAKGIRNEVDITPKLPSP